MMLSIITPVFNGERFIESCIKVVIDQNCPNIEHIIIDGGSTDQTVEIVKQYACKYPHIHWISEKDNGQSDAMNKGIIIAKGEIIGILNVDDFYEQNVLNRALEILSNLQKPSLIVGNCNIWSDEGNLLDINKPSNLNFINLILIGVHDTTPFPVNPSAYFYHTALHSKIGLYNVDEHYAMDVDFILQAVQVASVKYMDELWGNFRLIKGTKTFRELQSGECERRIIQKLEKYRKKITLLQKIQVNTLECVVQFRRLLTKFKQYLSLKLGWYQYRIWQESNKSKI